MNRYIKQLFFIVLTLFILNSINVSYAKMRYVPKKHTTTSFEELIQKLSKEKVTKEISDKLFLIKFGYDVLKIQNITYISNYDGVEKKLTVSDVEEKIRDVILYQSWDLNLNKKLKERLRRDSNKLKDIFYVDGTAWSWVLYQLGNKKKSLENMSALFNESYDDVMKMKKLRFRQRRNSLIKDPEYIFKALGKLQGSKDHKVYGEKLREMKLHVSRMPGSGIKT